MLSYSPDQSAAIEQLFQIAERNSEDHVKLLRFKLALLQRDVDAVWTSLKALPTNYRLSREELNYSLIIAAGFAFFS